MSTQNLVFATYAESNDAIRNSYRLAKSIREYGASFANSPVWLYLPQEITIEDGKLLGRLQSVDVEIRTSHTPEKAQWLYYAGKVYAAAEAEAAAENQAEIVAWMDEDSIVLEEPREFNLDPGIALAYCPVMHNRTGSLFDQPPNDFWSRIYETLSVTDDLLFPMITPADEQKIRAYFHAGLLVVRPGRKVLRRWPDNFDMLVDDPLLTDMCRNDPEKRIFLHQTALVGAVLHDLDRNEMRQLSDRYNYPVFFQEEYGATRKFNSIEDVTIIRCVVSLKNLGPDWHKKLSGPAEKVSRLRQMINDSCEDS